MPGKYSHSVILADYSSRGIISLPPDQFSKYLESAPLSAKPSVTQLRLRGTQSAQGVRRKPSNRGNGWSSQSGQSHVIIGNPPVPPKDRLSFVADTDVDDTTQFKPMRYSRYYDQLLNGGPVVGVTTQVSQPELSTAYRRQQQISANLESLPLLPKPAYPNRQHGTGSGGEVRPTVPVSRDAKVDPSPRKESAMLTTRSHLNQARLADGGNFMSYPDASAQVRDRLSPLDARKAAPLAPEKSSSPTATAASPKATNAIPVPNEARSPRSGEAQALPERDANNVQSAQSRSAQTDAPRVSKSPLSSPRTPLLAEPDFDGFSDMDFADFSPTGYYDGHTAQAVHSQSSSLSATLPIQRPVSSDRPSSRGQRSNHTEVTSTTLTVVVPNSDVNSPSRTTESSMKTSTRGQRSISSASSVSVANSNANPVIPKHSFEGSRKAGQSAPKLDQQWRLPEISEDHGFSPSIFEDHEGHTDNFKLNEPDSRPTIGQISSGRDVLFDNSDAMSELSAALPPPITRFRDEEDEFNANMVRLFGEGGDYAVNKKGSQSVGRSATKKTKGFFLKFRSKNSLPVK